MPKTGAVLDQDACMEGLNAAAVHVREAWSMQPSPAQPSSLTLGGNASHSTAGTEL